MNYQHIIVAVDGSDISFAAAVQAAHIAKAFNCKLTAISLIAQDPFKGADFYHISSVSKDYFIQARQNAEEVLKKVKVLCAEDGVEIETQIFEGENFHETLIKVAEEMETDLIVVGSHGRKGFKKFILGSFAHDVLNNTKIQVLVVKV